MLGKRARRSRTFTAFLLLAPVIASATPQSPKDPQEIAQLSLEELMQVPVTTVRGAADLRFASPAAIHVVSADEIRRAGHRTLAEALRLVPGMYVARINASSYVIGARGLASSSLTAARYLVLVDGRVVHDPSISTTFWDVTDLILDDVDRIEVIRGPGATLYGQNAMNGVINVITRPASETQGTLLRVGAGTQERAFTDLRHGGELGGRGHYRAWAKYADRDDFALEDGSSAHDAWSSLRVGLRGDVRDDAERLWTVQLQGYALPKSDAQVRLPVPGTHNQFRIDRTPNEVRGGHALLRVGHGDAADAGWSAQAYVDRALRDTSRANFERTTADVDFRHWFRHGRHQIVWGIQATHIDEAIGDGPVLIFDPPSREWWSHNAFVQDTIDFGDGRWQLTLGSKFTDHEFIGFAVQPSARVAFVPSARRTWWAAISRPVRAPSHFEEDGLLVFNYIDPAVLAGQPPSGDTVPVGLAGDRSLDEERLLAYELGHRAHLTEQLMLDVALFHNDYRSLVSVPPTVVGRLNDQGSGRTSGAELAVQWRPAPEWRFEGAYSHLKTRIDGPVFDFDERGTPRNLAQLRATYAATPAFELHGAVYYTDRVALVPAPAYERVDLGLTWRPRRGLELALWGQNLGDSGHREGSGVEVPRSVHAQLTFDFDR